MKKNLIKEILKLHFDKFTYNLPTVVLNVQEEKYYNKNIIISKEEAINLAVVTVGQQNFIWQSARQCRITASHCYELYTYFYNKNPDWDKKIDKYLNPAFEGNEYTKYGNTFEPVARDLYEKIYGKVYMTGLIVNPALPWLACSPDGLRISGGQFSILLEIKCPILGKTKSASDLLNNLSYIKCKDDGQLSVHCLNPKHIYYGQVQLSMAILDIDMCHFVIYSSHSNSIFLLEVKVVNMDL